MITCYCDARISESGHARYGIILFDDTKIVKEITGKLRGVYNNINIVERLIAENVCEVFGCVITDNAKALQLHKKGYNVKFIPGKLNPADYVLRKSMKKKCRRAYYQE